MYVNGSYIQAGHIAHRRGNCQLNVAGHLRNFAAVFNNNANIKRHVIIGDFHLNTLGQLFFAQHLGKTAHHIAAHPSHAFNF